MPLEYSPIWSHWRGSRESKLVTGFLLRFESQVNNSSRRSIECWSNLKIKYLMISSFVSQQWMYNYNWVEFLNERFKNQFQNLFSRFQSRPWPDRLCRPQTRRPQAEALDLVIRAAHSLGKCLFIERVQDTCGNLLKHSTIIITSLESKWYIRTLES